MKWNPYRMWRITIKQDHAFAEVEISNCFPRSFGISVTTYQRVLCGKMREEYDTRPTLREAKKRGEAMATELLQHAAQALGVV